MSRTLGFRWPLFLGAAGFLAGFIGPILLTPDSNQGPLLGIFITGPFGVMAGFVSWAFMAFVGVPAARQWTTLWVLAALIVTVTIGLIILG